MSLTTFLANLFDSGRVQVPLPEKTLEEQPEELLHQQLMDRAAAAALDFPGEAPAVDVSIARWAAMQLYRASQLAVYRELDAQAIGQLLDVPCPPAPPAIRHWSVDLTFVYLPDLVLLARSASEHDPLVDCLQRWACAWPLSSVGMRGVVPEKLDELLADPGLAQLYMDRILAKKDASRLSDARLLAVLRQTLGAHQTLWPEASKMLQPLQDLNAKTDSSPA